MVYHQIHPAVGGSNTPGAEAESTHLSRQQILTIENYVVYLHDCFFNESSNDAHFRAIYGHLEFHEKLKTLHAVASSFARSLGAGEQDICDHVLIRSVYCTYDRSLGQTTVARKDDSIRPATILTLAQQFQETA